VAPQDDASRGPRLFGEGLPEITASNLLLWATPEEVERARSRVVELQKPEER